jgi:hypothetical protein
MATAKLTPTPARQPASELSRVWLAAYGAIWGVTLSTGMIVAVAGPFASTVRHLLRLRLKASQTPAPQLGHIAGLAAHNIPIAAWPILLGVAGAHHSRLTRQVADIGLVGSMAVNVLPVGAALGAYGVALLPYAPQLPLEWAGLACGASAWLLQRRRALTVTQGVALLAATVSVLTGAAAVETLAVPHRQRAGFHANSRGGLRHCSLDTSAEPIPKEFDHEPGRHGCQVAT